MKKILILSAFLIVSANAYECSTKSGEGSTFYTMSNTYSESGKSQLMWFKWDKKVKGKIIESGKEKIELRDGLYRTIQSITYDKNNKVKNSYSNGEYSLFEEPIPETIGLWMAKMLKNGWALSELEGTITKKREQSNCLSISYGINMYRPTSEEMEEIRKLTFGKSLEQSEKIAGEYLRNISDERNTQNDEPINKTPSMTPEQTQKWLEENDPRIKR